MAGRLFIVRQVTCVRMMYPSSITEMRRPHIALAAVALGGTISIRGRQKHNYKVIRLRFDFRKYSLEVVSAGRPGLGLRRSLRTRLSSSAGKLEESGIVHGMLTLGTLLGIL